MSDLFRPRKEAEDLKDDLRELIEQWREEGDTLIHEGDNKYVEGRGAQLAKCAHKLEELVWNE